MLAGSPGISQVSPSIDGWGNRGQGAKASCAPERGTSVPAPGSNVGFPTGDLGSSPEAAAQGSWCLHKSLDLGEASLHL